MIHLSPEEKILMVLHRHWIVIATKLLLGAVLFLVPLWALPHFPLLGSALDLPQAVLWFFVVTYWMIMALLMFIFWMDYYLDVWIITSSRIVDIEQHGLFHREVSEFMLDKVQDITVEIPNITATLLKYGNIKIQTAGEREFSIKQIQKTDEAKNLILDQAKKLTDGK